MVLTKIELEEVLQTLENYKGRQTELITVYISAGYDVNTVQRQLEAEKSTAKNIKSTATRKNVSEALDKIVRHLKGLKKTPEHGLALFCGNISKVEGDSDLQLWDIEPPMPLKIRLYRCDKEFVLEPLQTMLEVDEVFALLVMDRKEATIGMLEGKRIEVMHKMTSGIPSKVRAGGQCLSLGMNVYLAKGDLETGASGNKYLSEVKIGDEIKALDLNKQKIVFTKVKNKWDVTKEKYLEIVIKDCWNLLVSEDHTFFKDVGDNDYKIVEILAKDLKKGDILISFDSNNNITTLEIDDIMEHHKSIKMIDLETEEENFFAEGVLVHNSAQRFHRITEGLTRDFYKRIASEMKAVFFEMPKLKGILVGGPIPTKDEFLDGDYLATKLGDKVLGAVDIGDTDEHGLKELVIKAQHILASQEIIKEQKLMERFFDTLGSKPDMAVLGVEKNKHALGFGAVDTLFLSKDVDKAVSIELKKMAENIGANIEIISTETTEGEQFKNLSGIGSILRFKV